MRYRQALRRFLQGKKAGLRSIAPTAIPDHHQNGALTMAIQEFTPTKGAVDMTPQYVAMDTRRQLVTVDPAATELELTVLADSLAMQAVELVNHWPAENGIPMALHEVVHQMKEVLNHLASMARAKQAA
jgi:hypothetical protein